MSHVLIVDDLEESRYLLRAMLEGHGFRVTAARDGIEALAAARSEPPDLVVSDALMPRMDGFVLCQAWMQDARLRTIPFAFYSASYATPDGEKLAHELGAVRYLVKPQEPDVLLAELHAVLREWQGRPAPLAATLDEGAFHVLHKRMLAQKLDDKLAQLEAANHELRDSEARYRTLFECAPDGIVILRGDPASPLVEVNASLCRMLGYTRDELLGLRPSDIVTAAEIEHIVPAINVIETRSPYYREWRFKRKDGSGVAAEVIATAMPDGNLLALIRDISERKRAEEALAESRARLEALTQRVLEVQESERRTIARELHDEVGGVLTAVKLNLQALGRPHSAEQREAALADGLALVDGAIQAVRSLSLDLRPAMLDDLGLIPALKWYCARQAQRAGVMIDLALDAMDLGSVPQLQSACFRIVQEAVTNALRHAGARRIQVALRRGNGQFVLEIADDGAGFEAAAARQRGLAGKCGGLLGMEERAKLLGGRLVIESAPGSGARVRAEFGLPEGGFA